MLFVYVIAWGRGQLRLISRVFSKFSQNCPSREATRAIWKTLKIQVKLILNCPSALAITCLSHKGQNFAQRTTFKVLPSLKQVCRLSESFIFNKLAVARGKPTIIVSKTQQLDSIHSKQFLYKQNLKQFNFIHLFCEACNGAKLSSLHRSMIDVNKCPNEL